MSETEQLVAAVLELERLLYHLRHCNACYDGGPCLEKHFMVKEVVTATAPARALARAQRAAAADHAPPTTTR